MLNMDFTSQDYLRDPATGFAKLRAVGPVIGVRFAIHELRLPAPETMGRVRALSITSRVQLGERIRRLITSCEIACARRRRMFGPFETPSTETFNA